MPGVEWARRVVCRGCDRLSEIGRGLRALNLVSVRPSIWEMMIWAAKRSDSSGVVKLLDTGRTAGPLLPSMATVGRDGLANNIHQYAAGSGINILVYLVN